LAKKNPRARRLFLYAIGIAGIAAVIAGILIGEIGQNWKGWKTLAPLIAGGALFLAFVLLNLRAIVASLSRRQALYGANVVVMSIIAGFVLILVNYLGYREYKTFDLTKTRIYSLSEQTKNILKKLEKKTKQEGIPEEERLTITCLYRPGTPEYDYIRNLLKRYEEASWAVRTRVLDPDRDIKEIRQIAQRYPDVPPAILVTFKGQDWPVESDRLFDYETRGLFQRGRISAFKGEQGITSAILSSIEAKPTKIYFLSGHGERDIESYRPDGYAKIVDLLKRLNYKVEELNLLLKNAIPDDCDVLVIAGPERSFSKAELKILDKYIFSGGRVLALLDPIVKRTLAAGERGLAPLHTGLEGLLAKYGLHAGDDIILDTANLLPFHSVYAFPAVDFTWHNAVKPLKEKKVAVVFDLARSARTGKSENASLNLETLVTSSSDSWATEDLSILESETAEQFMKKAKYKKGEDTKGPISIGSAASLPGKSDEKGLRLILIGDSDFADNNGYKEFANADLFQNCVNWLAERQTLIAMAPKRPETVTITIEAWKRRAISILVTLLMPLGVIVAGIIVFISRRG